MKNFNKKIYSLNMQDTAKIKSNIPFDYFKMATNIANSFSKEYPATLKLNLLKKKITINDNPNKITIKSLKVKHGKVDSTCFILNNIFTCIAFIQSWFIFFTCFNFTCRL